MLSVLVELIKDKDNFKLRKKGFTLVELLAVISILAIILVIVYPSISSVVANQRAKAYIADERLMEKATEVYINTGQGTLPQNIDDTTTVTLEELLNADRIKPILDAEDKTPCSGTESYVTITKTGDKAYDYESHLKCSNYETGQDEIVDTDGDGVSDADELAAGTNPNGGTPDTDGDTLYDDYEVVTIGTSPTMADTDLDGENDNVDSEPLVYTDDNEGTLEYVASGDYYIIGSLGDLIQWNKDVNNLTGDSGTYELDDTYYLGTDINIEACTESGGIYTSCTNDTDTDPSNGNWTPIGLGTIFNGSFLGNNHTINNININLSSTENVGFIGQLYGVVKDTNFANPEITGLNYVGIFGNIDSYPEILNVEATNVDINGTNYVGGLTGRINSRYSNVKYVKITGNVTGNTYVGGVVGFFTYGTAENIMSSVDVVGSTHVGGLIGRVPTSSYAANFKGANIGGNVTGTSDVHRVIGSQGSIYDYNGVVIAVNTIEVNGSTVSDTNTDGAEGADMPASAVSRLNSYRNGYFNTYVSGDEDGEGYYWDYGTTTPEIKRVADYPLIFDLSGSGTEADPYIVSNESEYKQIALHLDKYYKLTNNINMINKNYYVLGDKYLPFTGTIDGNGYTISNVTINETGGEMIGIIGYLYVNAELKDIKFDNINIIGNYKVGLVGNTISSVGVNNLEATNINITGNNSVGGLFGETDSSNARANFIKIQGNVTGDTDVGGIVGYFKYGIIENVIGNVVVEGNSRIGGLIGRVPSSSYSARLYGANIGGSVTGASEAHRVIGNQYSYDYTGSVLGLDTIEVNGSTVSDTNMDGYEGKNMTTAESAILATYNQIYLFDTVSDSDGDGYYWTMESGELTINKN